MNYAHLPHMDMEAYYQFITFRTADSTDDFLLKLTTQGEPDRERQMAINEYLDASAQGAYLYDDVLRFLFDFIRSKDGDLYKLVCFAIMPNHVHLLIKSLQKLAMVMQRVKGASAKGINDIMGRRGTFWEKDYYDKAIRDEDHFRVVYQYIKNNPLKLNQSGSKALDKSKFPCMESATKIAPPGGDGFGGEASASRKHCELCAPEGALPRERRFYGIYDA